MEQLYKMEQILKKSFMDGYASTEITALSVFTALLITFALGAYVFLVYRTVTRKTFYSRNFNLSLVGTALITAAVIVTIQSSLVVSLGMVGALSIVRFRTAIKDPMDLMFLFWSIGIGIICGAGYAIYAVFLSLALTLAILIFGNVPVAKAPLILVVNAADIDAEKRISEKLGEFEKQFTVKSRNMTASSLDLTIELRTDKGGEIVREMMNLEGVSSACLISHDGDAAV